MIKTYFRLAWLPAVVFCALVLSGCGETKGRYSIEGTVTLDGKPLETGQVNFIPLSGTKGPTAGSEIVEGKFSIDGEKGTFLGKFRVEVTSSRPSGRKMQDSRTGKPTDIYEQFLPEKYNKQSELEADVKADVENRFEFAMNSK